MIYLENDMNVLVINDSLEEFQFEINNIEEDGLDIFLNAKNIWNDDWSEYVVWYRNCIIQRVINPDVFIGDDYE